MSRELRQFSYSKRKVTSTILPSCASIFWNKFITDKNSPTGFPLWPRSTTQNIHRGSINSVCTKSVEGAISSLSLFLSLSFSLSGYSNSKFKGDQMNRENSFLMQSLGNRMIHTRGQVRSSAPEKERNVYNVVSTSLSYRIGLEGGMIFSRECRI